MRIEYIYGELGDSEEYGERHPGGRRSSNSRRMLSVAHRIEDFTNSKNI